ncbi:hypothetical protein AVEN_237026-1 [Araneus ventricosus]|uniref:DUF4817 domain-containing protein n=1 Tax=Araneus ventricosus TaxID=182803 RepID=A0A4Y2X7B6_ARAVE|nr:hypothetical protein AVEN_237026-1 [Araneus ventricosus]
MPHTKEERIDIILLTGSGTTRHLARTFNARADNPCHRGKIYHEIQKDRFRRRCKQIWKTKDGTRRRHVNTGASRSGRPKTAPDEGTSTQVLAAMARSPTKGTRRLSAQMGINQSSVLRNLRGYKWHPYKLQILQHLTEDDPDRRVEFYVNSFLRYEKNEKRPSGKDSVRGQRGPDSEPDSTEDTKSMLAWCLLNLTSSIKCTLNGTVQKFG